MAQHRDRHGDCHSRTVTVTATQAARAGPSCGRRRPRAAEPRPAGGRQPEPPASDHDDRDRDRRTYSESRVRGRAAPRGLAWPAAAQLRVFILKKKKTFELSDPQKKTDTQKKRLSYLPILTSPDDSEGRSGDLSAALYEVT